MTSKYRHEGFSPIESSVYIIQGERTDSTRIPISTPTSPTIDEDNVSPTNKSPELCLLSVWSVATNNRHLTQSGHTKIISEQDAPHNCTNNKIQIYKSLIKVSKHHFSNSSDCSSTKRALKIRDITSIRGKILILSLPTARKEMTLEMETL